MKGVRGERLAGEFQKEIYNIITNKLRAKEPSLSVVISVTGADVAPDLKSAKIFISVYDTNKERADVSFEIIKEHAGFIRRELSHIMTLRTVPELRFIRDESMEYGQKIDKLIYNLENKDERKD